MHGSTPMIWTALCLLATAAAAGPGLWSALCGAALLLLALDESGPSAARRGAAHMCGRGGQVRVGMAADSRAKRGAPVVGRLVCFYFCQLN